LTEWDTNKPNDYVGPDVIGFRGGKVIGTFLPWIVLPALFFVAWALILLMHCN